MWFSWVRVYHGPPAYPQSSCWVPAFAHCCLKSNRLRGASKLGLRFREDDVKAFARSRFRQWQERRSYVNKITPDRSTPSRERWGFDEICGFSSAYADLGRPGLHLADHRGVAEAFAREQRQDFIDAARIARHQQAARGL